MTWVVVLAAAMMTTATACRFDLPPVTPGDAPVIGDASEDWWDTAWGARRRITLKNDELTGPVQSFPLLVRLPAGVGQPDGADLRFLATDQRVILPHEIDQAGPGGVQVWVRFPDISNTGRAPVLWVYYDNPAAQSTSSGAAVFADRYVSVHHLDQDLGDATGNGHTASGQIPNLTSGQIGVARDFDGQDDYLELAGEAAYDFTTSFTVSAWIRPQALTTAHQAIVTKGDDTWRLHRADQTPFISFSTKTGGLNQNHIGDTSIGDGAWHHVAIVFGAATKQIYVDGQLDQAAAIEPTIDTSDAPVAIGYNSESTVGGTRNWNGEIDEVRISGAAHDAHWLFAEHHTVTDADFVTVGAEQTRPL